MASRTDPRVAEVVNYAEACARASSRKEIKPPLPPGLKNLTDTIFDYVNFTGAVPIGTNIILLTSKEDGRRRPRLLAQFNKDGKLQIKQVVLGR